ncbi:MAG: hypothetical protein IJU83_03375 [Clostridia bacterium]|nr:hypothetical protein [Clostridia bacterium]
MKGAIVKKGLSGNLLKIIAIITMTADHVGAALFPQYKILRIIGRITMPIFAFLIAEGCYYTKNKLKYFGMIFLLGVICTLAYYIAEGRIYLTILTTFSFSILMIFALEHAFERKTAIAWALALLAFFAAAFFAYGLPALTGKRQWAYDYGFFCALLPVGVYLVSDFRLKLLVCAAFLTVIAFEFGGVQWWAYLALGFLAFYDGTRGKYNIKYFFYLYYPLHLVAIYGISMLI